MAKATQQTKPNSLSLVGKVSLDNIKLPASEIEIAPAGNGLFAITIRVVVDEETKLDTSSLSRKEQSLKYSNKFIPNDREFIVSLAETGIMDQDNKCTIVLFYKGRVKEPLVSPITPSIIVAHHNR